MVPFALLLERQPLVFAHRVPDLAAVVLGAVILRGPYRGGCLVAGVLALLPGRFLGTLLWQHTLGATA